MAVRQQVEQRSGPALVILGRQPRWRIASTVALLFAGLLLLPTPAAALCLVALLAFVSWLTFLSWPALDRRARTVRVVAALFLLLLGLSVLV